MNQGTRLYVSWNHCNIVYNKRFLKECISAILNQVVIYLYEEFIKPEDCKYVYLTMLSLSNIIDLPLECYHLKNT